MKIARNIIAGSLCLALLAANLPAVTSNLTEFKTAAQFTTGDPNGVVIDSKGTVYLNRESKEIAADFDDVWTINSIVVSGGDTLIGTSPNAAVYKITDGKKTKIYESPKPVEAADKTAAAEPNIPAAKNAKDAAKFSNEHVFTMALDAEGRLIVGISGKKSRVLRFTKDYGKSEVIYEPEKADFIFAIDTDEQGNIYLATGPKGDIFKISANLKEKKLLYKCNDRNIISLKVEGDAIYAGSDKRGVLYRIKTDGSQADIVYDSKQSDITAIETDKDKNVYIAAAMAQGRQMQMMPPAAVSPPVQPEGGSADKQEDEGDDEEYSNDSGNIRLSIAATKPATGNEQAAALAASRANPGQSAIYKISPTGIVTTLAQDSAMFLDMKFDGDKLLVATDKNASVLSIDPVTRIQSSIYEDPISAQVTALCRGKDGILAGLSNPARLILIKNNYAKTGHWESAPIDAAQPAIWGKLQLDAQIPEGCSVMLSTRSGNVEDPKDPQMSQWSQPVKIETAVDVNCPVARFVQLRIILNGTADKTPVVRGIALANVVPNIAPVITGIKVATKQQNAPAGVVLVTVMATDENDDQLVFKFDIRNIKSSRWIEVEEESKQNVYKLNALSIPDGIYEIKATASDKYSNSPLTALTASWISEPVVIDNTPPAMTDKQVEIAGSSVTVKFNLTDEFSTIGTVKYTVNSKDKWISILPDDLIYDGTTESFTIVADDLTKGEHIISIETKDGLENTKYESFFVEIK